MDNNFKIIIFITVISIAVLGPGLELKADNTILSYDAGTAGNPPQAGDPQSQGWLLSQGSDSDLSAGDVSPDGTTGFNAWNVTDNTSAGGQYLYYDAFLTSEQQANANIFGWVMTAQVRHLDNYGGGAATYIQYGDQDQHRFLAWFLLDGDGNLNATLTGSGGGTYQITDDGSGADIYHNYKVEYNPVTSLATFSVDDVVLDEDWFGETSSYSPTSGVRFGSGSSGNKGSTNYNYVGFEILPPPPVVIVESDGSTAVSEGVTPGDTYEIQIQGDPQQQVQITVSPDDQLDVGAGGGNPIFLTFTPGPVADPNFVVEVQAVDDQIIENNHTGTISHTSSSAETFWNNAVIPDVEVGITDNDEGCGQAGTLYLRSDLNRDCFVNLLDLYVFVSQWLSCTDPTDPINCVIE